MTPLGWVHTAHPPPYALHTLYLWSTWGWDMGPTLPPLLAALPNYL